MIQKSLFTYLYENILDSCRYFIDTLIVSISGSDFYIWFPYQNRIAPPPLAVVTGIKLLKSCNSLVNYSLINIYAGKLFSPPPAFPLYFQNGLFSVILFHSEYERESECYQKCPYRIYWQESGNCQFNCLNLFSFKSNLVQINHYQNEVYKNQQIQTQHGSPVRSESIFIA